MEPYKLPIDYPEAVRIIKEHILQLQDTVKDYMKASDDPFYKGELQGLHLAFEAIMDQIPY